MYNTDTATLQQSYQHGYSMRDFTFFFESLYKKRTGEFFLYGYGSHYSYYAANGEQIRPLSVEQAKKWVEKYCTSEEYEEIFGAVEE